MVVYGYSVSQYVCFWLKTFELNGQDGGDSFIQSISELQGQAMNIPTFLWALIPIVFITSVLALPREIPVEEVPPPVLQRFKSTYPGATNVQFKDEHINPPNREYEVSFEINGKRQKTQYAYDGQGVVEDIED